jgi:GNAT superfamily N-acetyltransferase
MRRETDAVTIAIESVAPAHRVFADVAALFDDYRVHQGEPPAQHLVRDWLAEQVAQHRLGVAAAIDGDRVCGLVTTTVMPASLMLGTFWWIRDLYVAPPFRRRGVARALLRHVIAHARAAGALRVSLQTEAGNGPALTLYADAGFRPVTGLELLSLPLRYA